MSQSKATPYYQELEAAYVEGRRLREEAREAKLRRARELLAEGFSSTDVARRLGLGRATMARLRGAR